MSATPSQSLNGKFRPFFDKLSAKLERLFGPPMDKVLDRIGPARQNLARLAQIFERHDNKEALIVEVRALGPLPLGYPRIKALSSVLLLVVIGLAVLGGALLFFARGSTGAMAANRPLIIAVMGVFLALCVLLLIPLSLVEQRRATHVAPLRARFVEVVFGIRQDRELAGLGRREIKQLFAPFFKRGNHDNDIGTVASGEWVVGDQTWPCSFFSYEYVDKTETSSKDDDRDTTTRYTRWGLVVQNVPVQGIALSRYKNKFFREAWDTGAPDFDRVVKVSVADPMTAARLLQPATVLKLKEWLGDEPDFELAFAAGQPVMMWQSHRDVFATDTDFADADTASALADRLAAETLPGYRQTLDKMRALLAILAPAHAQMPAPDPTSAPTQTLSGAAS